MSLEQWLKKLLPKQEQFYAILSAQVRVLQRMTDYLQKFSEPGAANNEEFYIHCHEIEQQGDELVKEMAKTLAKTFVTPLDREDLYHLSVLIENVIDACDEAARQFKLLPAKETHDNIAVFLNVLGEAAQYLVSSIDALASKKFAIIVANDDQVKRLEKTADGYYREQITELFNHCNDIKLLFIEKEIIEKLEEANDQMAHLSTFLTNLAVKHG
ncbi:MAG: Phosphate transport regulator [Gammaproteobacteria bacterium]|nr:Phosphate transport regulator [Gammaproteobacteria bacterium]